MGDIGQRFREVRKARGLTGKALAALLGVSQSHISMVESGQTRPSDLMLKASATALSVSEAWLRTGEGPIEATPATTPIISTDRELQTLQEALAAWWAQADEDERAYLRVVLRRALPELGGKATAKR